MKTTFNNHPLIPNSNQYFLEQRFVSIHSNDRDVTKYPNSAEFEIMLPQDYLNVASARLYSWSFPANYNVFSVFQANLHMTFKFTQLYNPLDHAALDPVLIAIYAALQHYGNNNLSIVIEPGFYNPTQMTSELQNKLNAAVTNVVVTFLSSPDEWDGHDYTLAQQMFKEYDRFKVVYNTVSQQLWFGNTADNFVLTNGSDVVLQREITNSSCLRKNTLPQWTDWGLPAFLGFTRCDAYANSANEYASTHPDEAAQYMSLTANGTLVPRFFYGDAIPGSGDNGYWLISTLPGASVYFLQAPLKISFMGPAYIYMDIEGMNCIDETSPYNLSKFTETTNATNSIVNSAFAKIPVPTTPISQWFDNDMMPYKYWNPPAERIRKLKIKFKYHNGMLVEFGQFEYSFMLEFNLLKPQIERAYSIVNAYDLSQQQSMKSKYI